MYEKDIEGLIEAIKSVTSKGTKKEKTIVDILK